MPAHGRFWADMFGPLLVVGIGTAFAFIPISIGALTGIAEHEAGLASGLIYTSQELGGAIGIAIASSVAATHYDAPAPRQHRPHGAHGRIRPSVLVLGAIALIAVPAVFALIRSTPVAQTPVLEPQPAMAGTK
jgi:hypothetical protein